MAKKKKKAKKLSQATKDIAKCYNEILTGTILCIDPSSGSASSMPGYAIYKESKLVDSGILEVETVSKEIPVRLKEIGDMLRDGFDDYDVLVIEFISPVHGGGGMRQAFFQAKFHASLLKSVGCVLGTVNRKHTVQIHPRTWQKYRDEYYEKSDHKDAEYMGICAIAMAKEMKEKEDK